MDIVFNAPDYATLLADAQRLGFARTGRDGTAQIATTGPVTGGGSYFLNYVGEVQQPTGATTTDARGNIVPVMAPLPGVWGRLRVNGDTAHVPTFSATITQYHYVAGTRDAPGVGWTADGVTPAPDYVGTIGIIS